MAFIESGFWAQKAMEATSELRAVELVASSRKGSFKKLPYPIHKYLQMKF